MIKRLSENKNWKDSKELMIASKYTNILRMVEAIRHWITDGWYLNCVIQLIKLSKNISETECYDSSEGKFLQKIWIWYITFQSLIVKMCTFIHRLNFWCDWFLIWKWIWLILSFWRRLWNHFLTTHNSWPIVYDIFIKSLVEGLLFFWKDCSRKALTSGGKCVLFFLILISEINLECECELSKNHKN